MKGLVVLALLLFSGVNNNQMDKKITKLTLVFNGIQNKEGSWKLWFENKKDSSYYFNAKRSNTEPYVFYTTAADGSLKENEKIKGSWFVVSYSILKVGNVIEKIIARVESLPDIK
jgi:hypothetical protein